MNAALQRKTVYVNDLPIGRASTWDEVDALLKANGILFTTKPGKAEGPTGFYVQGATTEHGLLQRRLVRRDANSKH